MYGEFKESGILGIGIGDENSLLIRLLELDIIEQPYFSIKFNGYNNYIEFGDPSKKEYSISWVTLYLDNSMNLFTLPLKKIEISSNVITMDIIQCVVDTGSILSYLPEKIFSQIKSTFFKFCNSESLPGLCNEDNSRTIFEGFCFAISEEQFNAFPDLSLYFGNTIITFPPSQYLVDGLCPDYRQRTFIFAPLEENHTLGIIGLTVLHQFHIHFDISHSQFGFSNN